MLYSFEESIIMESILKEGNQYVKGHITSIDKWLPNLPPSLLKGMSAMVCIRMTNLAL